MSNLGNYSPYNKTYKFIMFQNQAYHQKNKLHVKPCVRTNLRYGRHTHSHDGYFNPQLSQREINNISQVSSKIVGQLPEQRDQSQTKSMSKSMMLKLSSRSLKERDPMIHKQKRVVHKHESHNKFRNIKIMKDNQKLANRLIWTSCHVVKKQKLQKSFSHHIKRGELAKKYDEEGTRKHRLVIGNHELLNPILKDYHESGLGPQFIQGHMSWQKSQTPKTSLRKRRSNFSCL